MNVQGKYRKRRKEESKDGIGEEILKYGTNGNIFHGFTVIEVPKKSRGEKS